MVFVFVFVIFFLVVIVESKEGDEKAPALASCWGLDGLTFFALTLMLLMMMMKMMMVMMIMMMAHLHWQVAGGLMV